MSTPPKPRSTSTERRPAGKWLPVAALAVGLVGLMLAPDADSWERAVALLGLGVAGITLAIAWRIRWRWAASAPPYPRSTSAGTRATAEALNLISTTVVAGCLAAAAVAAGGAGLVILEDTGADSWTRLFAFLGLGIAGLALLAGLPHALILRWAIRHRRSPVSLWPTLTAVTASAILFPAAMLTIAGLIPSGDYPIQVLLPIAVLAVLLVVEINLMVHLSRCDKGQVGLSSSGHRDDDTGHK